MDIREKAEADARKQVFSEQEEERKKMNPNHFWDASINWAATTLLSRKWEFRRKSRQHDPNKDHDGEDNEGEKLDANYCTVR